jgi:hypothetical protein
MLSKPERLLWPRWQRRIETRTARLFKNERQE